MSRAHLAARRAPRAGAIWRVSGRLALDAGIRAARSGGVRTTELRAGLTWAFRVGHAR